MEVKIVSGKKNKWLGYALLLIACIVTIAMAVGGISAGLTTLQAAAGGLALVVVCSVLAVLVLMGNQGKTPNNTEIRAGLKELREQVERLGEQAALSDDARRVLNRRRERELLRHAIEEDIAVEDWDAAMVLVKELAERFGYRVDAEEFRGRIEQARYETVQRRVDSAITGLNSFITERRWESALAEAARIGRLYPDSPRVEGLRHRVEKARTLYKQDLERRFLLAAQDDKVDEAMELLRELDAYLTEREAEPYRETARGVIGKAKENLGVQFKLAIQDRNWKTAADVGEKIIDAFPNSLMAEEVRETLDQIRENASV